MKKLVSVAFLLALSFLVKADTKDGHLIKPYVGIELHARDSGFNAQFPKDGGGIVPGLEGDLNEKIGSLSAISAHFVAGQKFHENWGMEAGVQWSSKRHSEHTHRFRGFHLGLNNYVSLNDKLDLVSSIAASHVQVCFQKNSGKSTYKHNMYKVVPRTMSGFEYKLNDSVSMRLSAAWEKTNMLKNNNIKCKNSMVYNLGLISFF